MENRLTFIKRLDERTKDGKILSLYQCSCGNIVKNIDYRVKSNRAKSCGCLQKEKASIAIKKNSPGIKRKDLEGEVLEDLTVISLGLENTILCKCTCGNEILVKRSRFLSKNKKNCGCKIKEPNRIYPKYMTDHKLYSVWQDMKRSKCGGIIEDWNFYPNFYEWAIEKYKVGYRVYVKDFNQPHSPDNTIFVLQEVISRDSQNQEWVKEKVRETNRKKYGYDYPIQDKNRRGEHFKNHPSKRSKQEDSFISFLNTCGYEFKSDRKILSGREIDGLNNDLKLGFEYNGIFYHSSNYLDSNYHYNKFLDARKSGISLYFIFSDQWLLRRQQVKHSIRSLLSFYKDVVPNEYNVLKLDNLEAFSFMNDNHLFSLNEFKNYYSFGMCNNIGVLSALTFFEDDDKIYLSRFCTKEGYMPGDSYKTIFKEAVKYFNNDIVSYSDNTFPQEDILLELGFKFNRDIHPEKMYIDAKYPKERLIEQPEKYYEIYDCGKKEFIFNIR